MQLVPDLKFYAIFHVEKGFLPQTKRGRGYSYTEFGHSGIPRLFPSHRSAKAALTQWLRGHWTQKTNYDIWGGVDDTYFEPKDVGRYSQKPFIDIREITIQNLYNAKEEKAT